MDLKSANLEILQPMGLPVNVDLPLAIGIPADCKVGDLGGISVQCLSIIGAAGRCFAKSAVPVYCIDGRCGPIANAKDAAM